MAFAFTRDGKSVMGNKRVAWGTFTNASGDTGGNIDTGLVLVESMYFAGSGAGALTALPSVNETLPASGGAITIVCADGEDGYWFAIGR
jgi:hypothetical protein